MAHMKIHMQGFEHLQFFTSISFFPSSLLDVNIYNCIVAVVYCVFLSFVF